MSSLRLTWLLAALNVLVLFWAVSVYQNEYKDEILVTSKAKKSIELPTLPIFIPQTVDQFSDILDRPIFNEFRLPSENETTAIEKVSKNSDNGSLLKLVGVVLLPEGSQALILKPDRKVEKVTTGQKVDGWELMSINKDRVVLEQSGKKLRLQLDRKSQYVPSRKQRAPPVRRKQDSRKPARS